MVSADHDQTSTCCWLLRWLHWALVVGWKSSL